MMIFAKSRKIVKRFSKSRLPVPSIFWKSELPNLRRCRACCPLHGGDNPTSFSVNMVTGAFHCFRCGATGTSLIDYIILRDKCDFKTAAQTLGAWDNTDRSARERAELARTLATERRRREKIQAAADELAEQQRVLRIAICARLRSIERRIVQHTDTPLNNERWWHTLARLHDLQRLAVSAYHIMAFADQPTQVKFLRGDRATRIAMATAVLLDGFVRDIRDEGVLRFFDHCAPERQADGLAHGIQLEDFVA